MTEGVPLKMMRSLALGEDQGGAEPTKQNPQRGRGGTNKTASRMTDRSEGRWADCLPDE
jgi:hypothetical protein